MADSLSRKLLQLPSSFHHRNTLHLHIPPHLTLSPPPRRRSTSPRLPAHSNPPAISHQTVIVAKTVCVDGSLLFRFGDPSEVVSDYSGSDSGEGQNEKDLIGISIAKSGLASEVTDEGKTVTGSTNSGLVPKALSTEKRIVSSAKSGLVKEENDRGKIALDSMKSGSVSKAVGNETIVTSSDKAASSTKGKIEEKIISSSKSGSVLKAVGKEKISVRSAKAGSNPKEMSKGNITKSSSKSGLISKSVGEDKVIESSVKSVSNSKAVNEDKIADSSVKCSSSDDVVLGSDGMGKNIGNVVGSTVVRVDVNEQEFDIGSVGVEEREILTGTQESRTDFHEEGDTKCSEPDDVVLETNAVEIKTGNTVESSVLITDVDERDIEKGCVGVEDKESLTNNDTCCSSDDAVLLSNATEMKTGNVVHADVNEQEFEIGSVGVKEGETLTGTQESITDFHEEGDIKCSEPDDVVLETNAIEMKTCNTVESSVFIADVDERDIEKGCVVVEDKESSTNNDICCSSDDAVLLSNATEMKTGDVAKWSILHADMNEQEFEIGSVGVKERETLTGTQESRTDFHEEGDIECSEPDDVVLETNVIEMKTCNTVESSVLIADVDERDIEKRCVGVEDKETSTSDDTYCSSDDAVLLSNATEMKTANVAEWSILDTDANKLKTETGSIGIEEKGTPTSVVEASNDIHVDIEKSIPSEDDSHGEINYDDNLSPLVSLKVESNEECDSNEVTEIGENRLNVDDFDSLEHIDGSVTDDYEVELMPKYARLEADLALEEEIDDDLTGDLSVEEGYVNSAVDDDACPTILAAERTDSDIGSNDILDYAVGIEQIDSISKGDELSSTTLTLASGVASLPSPSQVMTGAEDAYFVADENWFIVANSVGQWSLKGMTPGLYAHKVIQNFQSVTENNDSCKANVREVLKQTAATEQLPGLASVLIAHFDKEVLHVANIGDTGFIIIRSGAVHKRSTPVVHEFNLPVQIGSSDDPLEVAEEYQVHLDDGDVIIMGTDGLFDNLYEKDVTSIVVESLKDNMKPKDLAELLAARAKEVGRTTPVRCPFADAAQAAGYTGYTGGKLDHVTVIVSLVEKQLSRIS